MSSGWSKTFQHLFGKLEEAKNFFTDLANGELADAIYKIGEWRNTILEAWNMPTITGEGVGGSAFRQTILNLTDILGMLFKAMLNVFGGFDELDEDGKDGQKTLKSMGERLAIITVEIRNSTYEFKKWLTDPVTKGGPTRIEMLSQAFKNLGAVFGIIGKVIGVAFKALGRVFNLLSPIFDGFLVLLNKITEPFVKLRDESTVFKDMENSVDNIYTILKPVAAVLGKIVGFLGDVAAFFISMAIDTVTANISFFADVLGLLLELFTGSSAQKLEDGEGVLGKIRKDFEGIKEACTSGLTALKEFFGALISDIRKLLGLSDEKDMDQNGGFFTNVINFFNTNEFVKSAKEWIDKAIVDIGNFIKSIPSRLVNLGFNIYDAIRGLFFKDVTKYNGSMLETKTELTPLGQWVDKLIKDIKEWFVNLPQRIIDGVGKALNWINGIFDALFGDKKVNKTDQKKETKNGTKDIKTRFNEFVENAITAIKEWFADLPNKIRTAWKNISNFATNLWNIIDEFLFGKKVTSTKNVKGKNGKSFQQASKETSRYKTGFSKFLDNLITEIKKFIKKIPEYIKKAISGAGDIITMILNALFGMDKNHKEVTNKDVEKGLEKPFLGINLTNILNTIKEIGATLLNNIAKIFTGTDDAEKNAEWFAETIAKGIRWIRDKAIIALHWVLDFLKDIPSKISSYFKGENKNNAEAGPVGKAILGFGEAIGKFIIEDLPNAILDLINGTVDLFDTVWNALYDKITEGADEAAGEAADKQGNKEPTGLAKLVEKIKTTFINVFQHLPEWVAKGLDMAVIGIQNILENIGNWINPEKSSRAVGSLMGGMTVIAEKAAKEEEKEPALVTAIKNLGEHLKNLIVTTIPGFIQDAWTAIGNLGGQIWKGIQHAFNGDIEPGESEPAITKIAFKIAHFIRTELPKKVVSIWKSIKIFGVDLYKGIQHAFTGEPGENDRQDAITNIVTAIKNFITQDLPSKVAEIWEGVKQFGIDLYQGILCLFTGEVPKTDRGKAIAEIVGNISSIIEDAIEAVKNLFKGPEQEDIGPIAIPFDSKETKKMLGKMRKETEAGAKETEKSGFWTFIDTIKNSILSAFSNLGPAILNGLATALDFLSQIAVLIINVLTGDTDIGKEVDKAYNEEKPELKAALIKIGESLRKFFLETLPYFIGSAIGTLVKEAPGWFDKLFKGINKGMEESADKATNENKKNGSGESIVTNVGSALDAVGKILDMVGGFIGGIGFNKDIVSVIALIIALGALLSKMSDLFSAADELEEGAKLMKWTGITLAIAAISGIFSWITKIIDEDAEKLLENKNYETKFSKLEKLIEHFEKFIDKVVLLVGLFSGGKAASSLFDMIGSVWGGDDDDGGGGVGDIFKDFAKQLLGGAAGAATVELLGMAVNDTLSKLGETILTFSSNLTDVIGNLTPFIDKLAELDEKIEKALSAITGLRRVFKEFFGIFGSLYRDATGKGVNEVPLEQYDESTRYLQEAENEDDGTTEEQITAYYESLLQRVEIFNLLSSFVSKLMDALQKTETVGDIEGATTKLEALFGKDGPFKSFITTVLNTLADAIDASDISPTKLKTTQYLALRNSGVDVALGFLTDSLSMMVSAASGITGGDVSKFGAALDSISKLSELMNQKDGAYKELASLGTRIRLFGEGMKRFFDAAVEIKGVDENGLLPLTAKQVGATIAVAKQMAKSLTADLFTGVQESWGITGTNIGIFGEGLKIFYDNVSAIPGFDDTDMQKKTDAKVKGIMFIAEAMSDLMELSQQRGFSESLMQGIINYLPSLGTAVGQFLVSLDTALPTEMTAERAETINTSVQAMAGLLSSIADLGDILLTHGSDSFDKILDRMFGLNTVRANSIKIASLLEVFDEALLRVMESDTFGESYKRYGGVIAQKVSEGIQAAFDEDPELRIKITPVLNMNDTVKKNLREQLAGSYGFDGTKLAEDAFGINNQTDADRITKAAFDSQMQDVIKAIKSGPDNAIKATDLITAFASMRMVFDTGAMAGELAEPIDQMIGTKIWQLLRGNASAP